LVRAQSLYLWGPWFESKRADKKKARMHFAFGLYLSFASQSYGQKKRARKLLLDVGYPGSDSTASISPSVATRLVTHTEMSQAVLFEYDGPFAVDLGVETTVMDELDEVALMTGSMPIGMKTFI
jgi:hypothetical protein